MHLLDFPWWLRALVKYIQRIEFIADYRNLGKGQGGWREDYQFYSPEAGI